MSVDFMAIVTATLLGIPVNAMVNMGTSALYERISRRDLENLVMTSIENAIHEKHIYLKRFSDGPVKLDRCQLKRLFASADITRAIADQSSTEISWKPFLKSFMNIIVIPGCNLSPDEYMGVIESILKVASDIFGKRVPYERPALDQLVLIYLQTHSSDHKIMISKIDELSSIIANQNSSEKCNKKAGLPNEIINPFALVAADDFALGNPKHVKQIRSLFVTRNTELPTARKHFNTIFHGQRGTGKTMILKYLSFQIQINEWVSNGHKSEEFFTNDESFIGIYCKLGQGVYDKSDFVLLDEARRARVFEHRLTLQLLYDVLETMKSVYSFRPPSENHLNRIRQALRSLLKTTDLDNCTSHVSMIQACQDCLRFSLIQEVDEYLGSIGPGGTGQVCFDPRLTLESQLLPFLQLLQESCITSSPFYIMLDDFDVLEPFEQSCVFRTAALRQDYVWFKFGIMALGRKVSLSTHDRTFRSGDDYDSIDLDWTKGGLHRAYKEAALAIAHIRLEESKWLISAEDLFPEWPFGATLFEEVDVAMREEWQTSDRKRGKTAQEFVSKYGNARFFQTLRHRKIRMRYAGIPSILDVSSGIFRQFLVTCKLIVDRAQDTGWSHAMGGISAEIQDRAIREYSAEMVSHISDTAGDAEALLSGDIEVTSRHMITLIESLSDLFYSRLHTPQHGEPEIICFAVRDDLAMRPDVEIFLDVAVRESILHKFYYAGKHSGGSDLPVYMLNRRLGPRRDLSIGRMNGRIELSADDVLRAVSDRKSFMQCIKRGHKVYNIDNESHPNLFSND